MKFSFLRLACTYNVIAQQINVDFKGLPLLNVLTGTSLEGFGVLTVVPSPVLKRKL